MLQQTFSTLADNEQWLAENHDKTVHANAVDGAGGAIDLAAQEEHVLRCLGAALIMQWNALPTKLQRELFDDASSMGELLDTVSLRGQIARFLHSHKDDEEKITASPASIDDSERIPAITSTDLIVIEAPNPQL